MPTITSLSLTRGHPTGGYLIEIIGEDFELAPDPPDSGVAPVPRPSVRVTFGGVVSPRVAVISETRLLVVVPRYAMPVDVPNPVASIAVDLRVDNIDQDGVVLGSDVRVGGWTYARPGVSGEQVSLLSRLVRALVRLLRSEVITDVVTHQSTDYDLDPSTAAVDSARLPQIILSGPKLERSAVYTDGVGARVPLAVETEFRDTRRPLYCKLEFDVTLVVNSDMHLFNLMSLITTVIDRSSNFTADLGSPYGSLVLPMDWTTNMATMSQPAALMNNIRVAKGTLSIDGFPFLEIFGTAQDATRDVSARTEEDPTLQPAEQIGDNLPAYQGQALRSPGEEDT